MTKEIKLDVDLHNTEMTQSPYWLVADLDVAKPVKHVYDLYRILSGPFFSRAEAETFLKRNQDAYSPTAAVLCFSGVRSDQYYKKTKDAQSKETHENH